MISPPSPPGWKRSSTSSARRPQAVGFQESPYDALLDEYEPGATAARDHPRFRGFARRTGAAGRRHRRIGQEAAHGHSRRANIRSIGNTFSGRRRRRRSASISRPAGLTPPCTPSAAASAPAIAGSPRAINPRDFNEGFLRHPARSRARHLRTGTRSRALRHAAGQSLFRSASTNRSRGSGKIRSAAADRSGSISSRACSRPFPAPSTTFTLDDFVFAVNHVEKSFIRVEADEATYNMHIILRFELEQALIDGDLQPADVPGAWNEKFQHMLDLTPPSDAQGCLQDIHWSMGGLGYFPTYTLGNLYAAQFMQQARQDLGDLDDDFRRGEFGRLKGWLNEKIHRRGQRFRPGELCRRVTGQPLSHRPLIAYLRKKYEPLYGI